MLLNQLIKGEKVEWWKKLPAPFITKDDLDPYYKRLDEVEAALKR